MEWRVEANRAGDRYFHQPDARELRDRYLPRLKNAIIDAYKIGPVTADDLVMLETYLRTYVSDENVRREIIEGATAAADEAIAPLDPFGIPRLRDFHPSPLPTSPGLPRLCVRWSVRYHGV